MKAGVTQPGDAVEGWRGQDGTGLGSSEASLASEAKKKWL